VGKALGSAGDAGACALTNNPKINMATKLRPNLCISHLLTLQANFTYFVPFFACQGIPLHLGRLNEVAGIFGRGRNIPPFLFSHIGTLAKSDNSFQNLKKNNLPVAPLNIAGRQLSVKVFFARKSP
jgi:hypothetical protein